MRQKHLRGTCFKTEGPLSKNELTAPAYLVDLVANARCAIGTGLPMYHTQGNRTKYARGRKGEIRQLALAGYAANSLNASTA